MTDLATPHAPAKAATPLMQQYLGIKARFADEIVLFRLGDFYEMFFEDAARAAPLLEVALTQRQGIPMCGVPHHAMTSYLAKLIKAGVSVAIAEQLEDPKKTKGMVKRDVVRVVTPGTVVEDELLPARANNFLIALAAPGAGKRPGERWALVAADVSTGRQWIGASDDDPGATALRAHLAALSPSEVLLVGGAAPLAQRLSFGRAVVRVESADSSGDLAADAAEALRRFLTRDRSEALVTLLPPVPLPAASDVLFLDETAVRHLELVASSDPGGGPTLLSTMDRCMTAVGSRLLKWWLLHPSLRIDEIRARLDRVQALVVDSIAREDLRSALTGTADMERIAVRAQAGTATPRDLDALRFALRKLPAFQGFLAGLRDEAARPSFAALAADLDAPAALLTALEEQLADEPPSKLIDGGAIRDGVNTELDALRGLRRSGKKWIAELEAAERERTGIGSLKIGYNDVFGYYIEVSKSNVSKVPADWIRKQTLANGERYVTPALKEQEEKILGAEDKIQALESRLFAELVHHVAAFGPTLAKIAEAVAHLDVHAGLAHVAAENAYVRPEVEAGPHLIVEGLRHPVVERQIGRERFIPNDVALSETARIAVITGPNMAGKSTYLRQTALAAILAQAGSFVPATSARVGLVDKIFTRIGASDRLAQGQSTFMVEMQEVANLLRHATSRSLLILDEVGRGTSTFDGVSIAWAVVEHLSRLGGAQKAGTPRTLFATHYFELTALEGTLPGVFNAHATAKEWPGPDGRRQVVFLYQIQPGAADRSYGIHVAEMAGLPQSCIDRSREILHQLESGGGAAPAAHPAAPAQLELFGGHPVLDELAALDVNALTPLEALNHLARLHAKAGGRP